MSSYLTFSRAFRLILTVITVTLLGQFYTGVNAPVAQAKMPCGTEQGGIDGYPDTWDFGGCSDNANWSGPKKNDEPLNYNGGSFKKVSHSNGAVSNLVHEQSGETYDNYFEAEDQETVEPCHDYILIHGDYEKATEGLVVPTHTDSFGGCVRYGASRINFQFGPGSTKLIRLNDGLAKDGRGKVRRIYETRKNNLSQQARGVCEGADPLNIAVCEQKIKVAFYQCYAQLTGGNVNDPETFLGKRPGDVTEAPTEAALFRCLHEKTGYPISAFNGIFSDPSKAHKVVCVLANIGWFFCPVTKFFAAINTGLMKFLTPLLNYDVLAKDTPRQKSLEAAWSDMRNIANIIFMIVFIFVIYSQVTGMGISNYGIKKFLPNLIVCAILINLSFWICTILIDISNILGATVFQTLAGTGYRADFSKVSGDAIANNTGWALGGIATVAIVGGTIIAGGVFALMGFLFPMLVTACLTLLMTMIILVGRQAAITILVVLSPVAFACMLLPGTKSWFDRWKGLFSSMLFLYPLVALVFGGSILASGVIIAAASGSILMAIFGLGVASIPIVVVPKVVQSAGGVFGFGTYVEGKTRAIGGKVAARGQNYLDRRAKLRAAKRYNPNSTFSKITTSKPGDGRIKRFGRRAYGSALGGSLHRQMLSSQADKDYESGLGQAASNYSNARLRKDDKYRNKVAAGNSALGARLEAGALQEHADYEDEIVEANMIQLASVSTANLESIMDNQGAHSDEEVAAAFREYASRVGLGAETDDEGNSFKGAAFYADALSQAHEGESPHVILRSVATAVNEHAGAVMTAKDIDEMRGGNFVPLNERITKNLGEGAVSQMDMAGASEKLLDHAASVADPAGMAHLKTTAKQLKANKDVYPLAKAVNAIDKFAA